MSQALGVAALIARIELDANSAVTAITNGISVTNPLAARRDSSASGKFEPSPTIFAIASHEAAGPQEVSARAFAVQPPNQALLFEEDHRRKTSENTGRTRHRRARGVEEGEKKSKEFVEKGAVVYAKA